MSQKKTTTKEDVAKANEFAKAQAQAGETPKTPETPEVKETPETPVTPEVKETPKAPETPETQGHESAGAESEAEADDKAKIDALAETIFEQYENLDVIYVLPDGSSAFETPELAASVDPDYITVRRPE